MTAKPRTLPNDSLGSSSVFLATIFFKKKKYLFIYSLSSCHTQTDGTIRYATKSLFPEWCADPISSKRLDEERKESRQVDSLTLDDSSGLDTDAIRIPQPKLVHIIHIEPLFFSAESADIRHVQIETSMFHSLVNVNDHHSTPTRLKKKKKTLL